ncbi:RNA polymerase III transcription factor IIIC subunit-domain-containing protein [Aspergillus granulosus]|uniref:RNA polymerase III transcription factor IIIC subunit-domain-containing protein n=1 Tax=Aspergillus granulosus TaxID=176169 RepID=A0ABR4HF56_9EURO
MGTVTLNPTLAHANFGAPATPDFPMSSLSLRASLGIGRSEQELWPIIDFDSNTKVFPQENAVVGKLRPLRIISFTQPHESGISFTPHSIPEDALVRGIICRLQELLQIRPVASAQFLWNRLNIRCDEVDFYSALSYCGYIFHDGPWKGALIRFDVDPRLDPVYRKYQTIYLPINYDPIIFGADGTLNLLVGFPAHRPAHRHCHLFDGQTITAGVQSWQLCDVTDDQLSRVISTENFRTAACDTTGYFFNGTWAKLCEIMYDKLICLRDSSPLPIDDYEKLLSIPDEYKHHGKVDRIRYGFKFGEGDTQKNAFLRRAILVRIKTLEH